MSKKAEMPKMKDLSSKEIKETIKVLESQLQNHLNQMQQHQTMATKAQGAIEVLNQLIEKQELDNDFSKDNK